jgi:hypothetical protein
VGEQASDDLISLPSVLCDWGDTEFSIDTDESRALADRRPHRLHPQQLRRGMEHPSSDRRQPVGTWKVGLVGDRPTIQAVAGGDVRDLVLVISYGGSLPAWPT